MEETDYSNLNIENKELSPFESDDINSRLIDQQLVYSGGMGINNRPHFFLAELESQVEVSISILNDNKVRILVIDHGKGILESFLPKLFNKFTQSDSSDTRQKGGTGLGLNVSKIIVEQMQGDIGVENTEGGGSTFWFEFKLLKNK